MTGRRMDVAQTLVQNKAVRQTPRKAINKKISAEDSDLAEDKADVSWPCTFGTQNRFRGGF